MGEQFGHYRLDGLIGSGGMGEVYRAFDTVRKRTVALKRLPAHLAADPDFQARFRREAELAARLTEPHIIPIHDYGEIDGVLFIDMRLISGIDLAELIRQVGPLPPARAVAIIAQVASALAAAHAARLVHRDVKPSNVLISESDRGEDVVHLLDFGVARHETGTVLTATGSAIGTVDYMAPEQFGDGPIDHRVDVYALGCVLYEALTAVKPFPAGGLPAKLQAHLSTPPPRPSQYRPDVPSGLDEVVVRAMAKHPDQRFASTTELAIRAEQSLRGALTTAPQFFGPVADDETRPGTTRVHAAAPDHRRAGPPPVAPPSYPTPTRMDTTFQAAPAGRGRSRVLLPAVAALVVVALAVAGYVFLRPGDTAGRTAAPAAAPAPAPAADGGETATAEPTSDAAAGSSAGNELSADGYASGQLASPTVTCTRSADSAWAWTMTGTIDGRPLEITYNTNYYRGYGIYGASTITDEMGGQLVIDVDGVSFVSNAATTGKIVVDEGEQFGSINATLEHADDSTQTIHVGGSWRCP